MSKRKRSIAGKLVLEQLVIPGKTGPVSESPKIWAINIAAAQDNFPRQGLLCYAGPWAPMSVGDFVKIKWGNSGEVLQKTIGPDDLGQAKTLFVESRHIHEGRADVLYSVKRVGQAWEDSEKIQLLIKLTRPGGHDDNADPGHSKLIFSIPQEILDGGIDKDNVAAGVPLTIKPYPNMAVGDVIQVTWGGVFVLSDPLTQDQVDGKTPIVVLISEAVIREAGDSDGVGLDVAYEVYDIADNRSEDWSVPQRVVVAVDATRILAPMLKEAVNNVLDLDTLGDKTGKARIWAIAPDFQVGDTIILNVKGMPLEGSPINIEISGKPLQNVPSTDEIDVPNALLRQLAKAQLVLSYRLKKANGSPDLRSKTQFIRVVGEIQRLAAPIALDAVQGALDPALTTVRIEIPWDDSFAAGQAIKLRWLGSTAQLTPYLPTLPLRPITNGDSVAKQPLKISVEGKHLTAINGGKLELYYEHLIDDGELGNMNHVNATHAVRESLHADILQVGEPRLELPEPDVASVVGGALPADTNGTTLTVNYVNTAKNDVVVYEWNGSKVDDGDSVTLTDITAGQPVSFDIEAEYIKGNEGGTVSASYFIRRAEGGTSYSNALELRVGAELVTPVITSVEDSKGVAIPQNGFTVDTRVTLKGTAEPNLEIEIYYNGVTTGGRAMVDPTGKWSRDLIGLTEGAFDLTCVARYGNKPVSSPWNIKVTAMVTPTITSIENGKGVEIPHGGSTVDTSVTINGMASKGQQVEVLDGTDSIDKAPVDPSTGAWTLIVSGLSIAAHSITAKAEYGAGPVSAARTFTVAALVTPVIASVKDPYGKEVPNNTTITNDSVNSTGTASAGEQVEIFVGSVSKGLALVNASGVWEKNVGGLIIGPIRLTAKGVYGSNPVSAARTFTVANALVPAIISVKDSNNYEIPENGTTSDTTVTLTGTATANLQVAILDGTTSKGKSQANEQGIWSYKGTGLTFGLHSFKAKAMYGSETESPVRNFTVTVKQNITEDWEQTLPITIPHYLTYYSPRRLALLLEPFVATPGSSGIYYSNPSVGQVLMLRAGVTCLVTFPGLAATFEIGYFKWENTTTTLVVYDEKNTVIFRENLEPNNGSYKIKKIDIGINCPFFSLIVNGTSEISAVSITSITWLQV